MTAVKQHITQQGIHYTEITHKSHFGGRFSMSLLVAAIVAPVSKNIHTKTQQTQMFSKVNLALAPDAGYPINKSNLMSLFLNVSRSLPFSVSQQSSVTI